MSEDVEPVVVALTSMDAHQQAATAACLLYEDPKESVKEELLGFDAGVRMIQVLSILQIRCVC